MISRYIKVTLRNLLKNIRHTLINVGGLTIGISCALVIFLVIQFEFSFDSHHQEPENIYRVVNRTTQFDEMTHSAGVPAPLPAHLGDYFPEIEAISVVDANFSTPVISGERGDGSVVRFKEENVAFVEAEYFDIFEYEWIYGGETTALRRPNTAVISRTLSEKLFGEDNPVGQSMVLQTSNRYDLEVTGVVEDPPQNTDLPFQMLVSYLTTDRSGESRYSDNWEGVSTSRQCYVRLSDEATAGQLDRRMDDFLGQYMDEQAVAVNDYFLQPIEEIHFDTSFSNYGGRTVAGEILLALALIGLFLLATACINYINLNTAMAVRRSREVGIRKTLGSSRSQLMSRYLGETALVALSSIVLALILTGWLVTLLRSMFGFPIALDVLGNLPLIAILLGLWVTVTVSAGLYPAFYLSGFNPIDAIRNNISSRYGEGLTLRRSLVVVQFVISQVLIIGTLTISKQMHYFQSADMGFTKEALVEIPIPVREEGRLVFFRNQLSNEAGIRSFSYSNTGSASDNVWTGNYAVTGDTVRAEGTAHVKIADEQFLETYGIDLLSGRNLVTSDTVNAYLVNESFAREAGYGDNHDELIGKTVSIWSGNAPIIGVVSDFNTTSLHQPIDPVVIASRPLYYTAGIRINPAQSQEALQSAEEAFKAAFPDYVFEYSFLEESVSEFYQREQFIARLMRLFTAIAILIGCLGLFGLVSYMAATRSKEIGIRKTMGATSRDILQLFGKEFGLLVGISYLLAVPIAWVIMGRWLAGFSYRIELGPDLFLLTLAATAMVVLLTVGWKTIRTAKINPVDSLRSNE